MFTRIAKNIVVFVFVAAIRSVADGETLYVDELYSNADGTIQFMVLYNNGPPSALAGQTLVSRSASGSMQNTYTFQSNLPDTVPGTANDRFLVATQGFADLHSIRPDFILPARFLFAPNGEISTHPGGFDRYTSLPADGAHAYYTTYDADIGGIFNDMGPAVAINHAGNYVALAPIDVAEVVEYYHAGLDEFFLTTYPNEIEALDAGDIRGWQRTGYSFSTWTGTPVDHVLVPGLNAVCRVYRGDTHFYALQGGFYPLTGGASECLAAMSLAGSVLESWNAFYAMEPDTVTGSCPVAQLPVYRLWNPRGVSHRYTTQSKVRDEMRSRGYVAEGYGPDAVAMCVPGTSAQ